MNTANSLVRISLLSLLFSPVVVIAQTTFSSSPASPAVSSPIPQTAVLLQTYQAEQQSLMQERKALVVAGATQLQLSAWYTSRLPRIQAQQQRIQAISQASALAAEPQTRKAALPADASPTLQAYLTTQADLANARAALYNQLKQETQTSGTVSATAASAQLDAKVNQLFLQQKTSVLALQAQRLQQIVAQSNAQSSPVPDLVVVPVGTSQSMSTYLTTRNQLRRSLVQLRNQYAAATPEARRTALDAWYRQNAAQVTQMRQLAQTAPPTATPAAQN